MHKALISWFSTAPHKAAQRELDTALRRLLEAEATKEYAQSVIDMNTVRIERLRAFIEQAGAPPRRLAKPSPLPSVVKPKGGLVRSV